MPDGKAESRLRKLKPLIAPAVAFLFLLGLFIAFQSMNSQSGVRMNGMVITVPPGYSKTYSDDRFAVWEYQGDDKKPGKLILDAEIRGEHAQAFFDAPSVLAGCPWLTEAEIYVNPQGVRMARGFSQNYSGYPERRYYVESETTVFLLCMNEDSRYYRPADCEEALRQTADGIRPANR